ncbi:hypothetical protein LFM09_21770 [Lentzea alba]|uniref:hypothetical protein n=1 Tax=Lentzea alba TaxID=2714351 RepID=UPI0039BFB714
MTNPAMNARWEQVLNYFQDGESVKEVASRDTLLGTKWLKWDVWAAALVFSKEPQGWDWKIHSMTGWMHYWAVASADYSGLEKPMNDFFVPMRTIIESLSNGNNPVAQPWTFDRAHNALNGTKNVLVDQSAKMKLWQDKVGKKGDDFQGAGASAFWKVLGDLRDKCDSYARQLGVRDGHAWNALVDAKGQSDNKDTGNINESKVGLLWAIDTLAEAYRKWLEPTSLAGYNLTHFGDPGGLTSVELAWPGAALNAVFNSNGFKADLEVSAGTNWSGAEHYAKSKAAGVDARNQAFWDRIEQAAKDLWVFHLQKILDPAAAKVVQALDPNYRTASTYLPTIINPPKVDLNPKPPPGPQGPPAPPPPGSGGGPKGPPGSGGGGGQGGPKGPPSPGGNGPNGSGPNGSNGSGGSNGPGGPKGPNGPSGPPPIPPPIPPNLPGGPNGSTGPGPLPPNSLLKVPTGSMIGPDGVVRDANGKPVLDRNGKQIVVPPGSKVNPDGEIIGPNGDKLAEKDRLQRPEVSGDKERESELDRYLKSLRGNNTPSLPTLLNNNASVPPSLHAGGSGSGLGGSSGVSGLGGQEPPPSPPKPVTTEGGPSLVKNQQGNGGPQNGMGGVPFYPPMAGGMGGGQGGGENKGERDRQTWLAEDEETWGTDPKLPPSVLGARRRRPRVGQNAGFGAHNHGQGGHDGRLAGGAAAPDHGRVEGSA